MEKSPRGQPSGLLNLQILTDELVKANPSAENSMPNAPFLSCMDQLCLSYSSFGGQLLFRNSVVTPLLKQAFSQALAELPWFAGRLTLSENGRTYDLACTNAGARLLVASTDSTLEQLTAVLAPGPKMAVDPTIINPACSYALPRTPDVIVNQQLPLTTIMLVHLYGGGCLLTIAAYHGVVDFEGLQVFVAHLSSAYNARLLQHQHQHQHQTTRHKEDLRMSNRNGNGCSDSAIQTEIAAMVSAAAAPAAGAAGAAAADDVYSTARTKGSGGQKIIDPCEVLMDSGAASTASISSATTVATAIVTAIPSPLPPRDPPSTGPTLISTGGIRPFFAADVIGTLSAADPPPVGSKPRENIVALPWWRGPLVLLRTLFMIMVRGGGLEVRLQWISPDQLAALKKAAMAQLKKADGQERDGEEGQGQVYGGVQRQEQEQGRAEGSEAIISGGDGGGGAGSGGGDGGKLGRTAKWVSTRDCLAARVAQLLHAVPLKSSKSMSLLVIANMRSRVRPPLPANQLGNFIWGARVDDVRPSRMQLGELAARVRLALDRDLPAQYCNSVRQVKVLTTSYRASQLATDLVLDPDPYRCLVAPEGPIMINEWRVNYDMWQFGPEPPLAFTPANPAAVSPNLIATYPPPPVVDLPGLHGAGITAGGGGGGGLCILCSLHKAVWKQLDQVTRGDLVRAL